MTSERGGSAPVTPKELYRFGLENPYVLRGGGEVYYSTVHESWAHRWEEGGEPYSESITEREAWDLIHA
jgi:hypothetical protein